MAKQYAIMDIARIRLPKEEIRSSGIDEDSLAELTSSIHDSGLIQDIVVGQEDDEGKHEIIVGARRFRAAMYAGLTEVPVVISELPREKYLLLRLVENIHHQRLDSEDLARALSNFVGQYDDQKTAAKVLGMSQARLSQLLELTKLAPEVKALAVSGVVRDKTTLAMANKLLRRAPEAAEKLLTAAKESQQLTRKEVQAALEPYTKSRKRREATEDTGGDVPGNQSALVVTSSSESAPAHIIDIDIRRESKVEEEVTQMNLPGFEIVPPDKVKLVKSKLAPNRDISAQELIALLVDEVLKNSSRLAA